MNPRGPAFRLAALLVVVLTADCARPARPADRPIVVGIGISPTNLDPGVAVDETAQRVEALVFSSLLKADDALDVVPDLAVRFETTDSQTYVAEIPGVDVLDRYTVAFRLHRPSASFPVNLVAGIVPEGTGPAAARHPIGSGPYRLAEFVPDSHVTLIPFARHYRGAPRNSGITLKVVPDDTMRGLELRKGDVDLIVNDLAPDVVHELTSAGDLQVITAPGTDWAYVGLNLRDEALADRRVRQALAYAIDTEAIATYLRRGLARPAATIVPSMSWAHAADAFRFTRDLAMAASLLDAAGYPDPDGAGPEPRLRLTLKTSTADASRLQAAAIQQQLREAGIALDLRSYEFATLMADVMRGNVQLYLLQFVGVIDPDMLRRLFHSSQTPPAGVNRGHYRNPEVDRLIDLASASLDRDERRAYYQEAQRAIARDVPVISLWAKTNVVIAQPDLDGIVLTPTADFSFLAQVSRTATPDAAPQGPN